MSQPRDRPILVHAGGRIGIRHISALEGEVGIGGYQLADTLIGRTIVGVGLTTTDSEYGDEPTTILFLDDGTVCMFVHAAEAP